MIDDPKVTGKRFRLVIFSSMPPKNVARIMRRIQRDLSDVEIAAVLYEGVKRKILSQRVSIWRKKIVHPLYWRYLAHRVWAVVGRCLSGILDGIIRLLHAAPKFPNGNQSFGVDDLEQVCCNAGTEFLATKDIHSDEALGFVRRQEADLGLVFGTRILKPVLYEIPKNGSINIHKRKVPDYRGGGPVGLWELLDGQSEIGVTVHRVEATVDVGAVIRTATIPIEPFDDLESLALKADVVGADLIVGAIGDFAHGTVKESAQTGPSKVFKNPAPEALLQMKRQLAARRKGCPPLYLRPRWKLLAKSVLHAPRLAVKNWKHRRRKDFPVIILYHHLIADRPHRFGAPTSGFMRQLNYLLRHYRVVSLSEAIELARHGDVAVPTISITFDDGYADNFINLRAISEATGVPIAYFIATEHVTNGREFAHDVHAGEHGFAPNTWDQIKVLRRFGYDIGSHTRNHADCGVTEQGVLHSEIIGSFQDIAKRIGPVKHFSFPFGMPRNISPEALELACATYENVFSAYGGENNSLNHYRVLKRWSFPRTIWELELQLNSVLNSAEEEPTHLRVRVENMTPTGRATPTRAG
jgi:folate-dependent phosphoribosylglycinamide formyltransferase PurN/peptidoglycan/xylan/chitin deacetylase (PgdA/CDA1 family)